MNEPRQQRRPRLAYPFTTLTSPDTVRLVAGEDFRYTLTSAGLDAWLPGLLERCTGKTTLAVLLEPLTPAQRTSALEVIEHLYGERVFVDGSAADAHVARRYHATIIGDLFASVRRPLTGLGSPLADLVVLCQDRLDYEDALRRHRQCRQANTPFLWVSCGALTRAYVSPLFLPDAGPCFGCLLQSFRRLSPAPEIYDALQDHARQGKPIRAVEFPHEGLLILQGLVQWKLTQAESANPDPALYRLHVLEREHFEVSTHRVFVDPFCPECGSRGTRFQSCGPG